MPRYRVWKLEVWRRAHEIEAPDAATAVINALKAKVERPEGSDSFEFLEVPEGEQGIYLKDSAGMFDESDIERLDNADLVHVDEHTEYVPGLSDVELLEIVLRLNSEEGERVVLKVSHTDEGVQAAPDAASPHYHDRPDLRFQAEDCERLFMQIGGQGHFIEGYEEEEPAEA